MSDERGCEATRQAGHAMPKIVLESAGCDRVKPSVPPSVSLHLDTMGKRAISSANVGAKKGKVARELECFEKSDDKLQFQRDLKSVQELLEKHPSRMKKVLLILQMDESDNVDKQMYFASDLANRSIARVPQKFLADEFFPNQVGGITVAQMKALCKADPKVAHKMLCRLCVLSPTAPIGPLNKSQWSALYKQRIADMGNSMAAIVWDENFEVKWAAIGHWQLLPALPQGMADPRKHLYDTIKFRDVAISLPVGGANGIEIRGHWVIHENFDHRAAFLQNPDCLGSRSLATPSRRRNAWRSLRRRPPPWPSRARRRHRTPPPWPSRAFLCRRRPRRMPAPASRHHPLGRREAHRRRNPRRPPTSSRRHTPAALARTLSPPPRR